MYYKTRMCFICLKSKSDLININTETLTKLLYFVDKTEDFIPSVSTQLKICADCLNKLNAAFHFKKMCLINIVQFQNYIDHFEQVSNISFPCKVETVELNDVSKIKEPVAINDTVGASLERHSIKQIGAELSNGENLDDIYVEISGNNEYRKECLDKELKFLSRDEIIDEELQNETAKLAHTEFVDVKSQIKSEFLGLDVEQLADEQFEKVLISSDHYLLSYGGSEFQKQSTEEPELLLHKEEILDNDHDEATENRSKNIIEHDDCEAQESSEIVSNEGSPKNKLLFICGTCEKSFILKKNLAQHVRIHNKNKKLFHCDKCQRSFTTKTTLKRHTVIHTTDYKEKPYSCPVCFKSFAQKGYLKVHSMLIHSKERPHSCSECFKSFKLKCSLTKHMLLLHSKERPHSCAVCFKSFKLKNCLTKHMSIHSEERPYSCSVCFKSFKLKCFLTKHMAIHSEERPYSCSVCVKSYKRKMHLNEHMLIHSKEKPFSCSVCFKSFNSKSNVAAHTLIHSEERPHSCSVCSKSFKQKFNLNTHVLLVHSKERSHACSVCSKTFSLKQTLQTHMLIHSSERPHSCSVCFKSFKRKSHLNKHILIHSRESPQS